MGAIQVKNVPEDLHDELRRRAEDEGTSISDYILRLIRRDLSLPSTEEWFSLLKANQPPAAAADIDAVAEIEAARSERAEHLDALATKTSGRGRGGKRRR